MKPRDYLSKEEKKKLRIDSSHRKIKKKKKERKEITRYCNSKKRMKIKKGRGEHQANCCASII